MATKQRLQRFQYRKEVGKTTATVYSIDLKFGFSKREESLLKAAKYIEKKKTHYRSQKVYDKEENLSRILFPCNVSGVFRFPALDD